MAVSHQVKEVSWWHEAVVDWLLRNPDKKQYECARHFDCSESYISILIHSDAFSDYYARRRDEHNNNVSHDIINRVEAVAEISLEVLQERIDKERETIGLKVVNDTCAIALKALGFGAKPGVQGGNTQVLILNAATPELLAQARDTMRIVNQAPDSDNTLTVTEEVKNEERPAPIVSSPA